MTQSSTMTKTRTPEQIVTELAPAYQEWKGGEKTKNKLKTEFFDAITEYLRAEGGQADQLVTVKAQEGELAIDVAEKLNPAWVAVDQREIGEGQWEVILEERPEYQTFTIEHDGQVWGRQVVEGATMLDDEHLEVDNPELWKAVTAYPYQQLLEDIAYEAGKDGEEVEEYIARQCERHGLKRSLKPIEEIDDSLMPQLKKYMYPAPPTIKLPAPKKVKE